MEQSIDNKKEAIVMISNINKVEGFDPAALAVDYTDASGQTYKRLPAMAQIAWFRLKYPEGKIAFSNIIEKVIPSGELLYTVTARVYADYRMDINSFLAEGTATRGYCKDKPSVSPKEWAQTAAIGIALRNAGFGLQFNIAGEDFPAEAPNELGGTVIGRQNIPDSFSGNGMASAVPQQMYPPAGYVPPVNAAPEMNSNPMQGMGQNIQNTMAQNNIYNNGQETQQFSGENVNQIPTTPQNAPQQEMTYEEKLYLALQMPCPINKYKGYSLGQVLSMDAQAINWIATKGNFDDAMKQAATLICEYALNKQASA